MKIFFLIFKLIFLGSILGASIIIVTLWNIQSKLPSSNISDYFPNEITKIYDTNYDLLYHVGNKDRFYLDYDQIPEDMINAIIAAEDKNFYTHKGFDLQGIFRSIYVNIDNIIFKKSNNYVGASTITQQLVKNILLTNEKTLTRKIKELILSIRIEKDYSKKYILELYLNEIYFGRRSYGIATAASNYFNKSIYDLTLDEYAYLAALPKGPNNYDTKKNYKKALERRNYVLTQMYENNFIDINQFKKSKITPIKTATYDIKKYSKSYNTDFILKQIQLLNTNTNSAYYVQSTINPRIQKLSEKALIDSLGLYEKKYRKWKGSYNKELKEINKEYLNHWEEGRVLSKDNNIIKYLINGSEKTLDININLYGPDKKSPISFLAIGDYFYVSKIDDKYYLMQPTKINGSMVVLNPFNGNILAMVGGVNYTESNFNRVTQAFRQPGSSIKPFIYALGLSNKKFLPNTVILDSQISLSQGPNLPLWIPKNYSNKSYGKMSFRRALETSNNLVTLKIGLDIGLDEINKFFNNIALYQDNNKEIYSLLLGSVEQNLLTLSKSYSIFVNGGYLVEPKIIKKLVTDKGYSIDNSYFLDCEYCSFNDDSRSYRIPIIENKSERILDEQSSFQILNILEGAINNGTGKALKNINYPIAGKTGTTNESKDLWFFGLTPEMVVGVYVGYDNPKKIGYKETGSSVALPIFKNFITNYLKDENIDKSVKFNVPKQMIKKYIDQNNYKSFDNFRENTIEDYFTLDQIDIMSNIDNNLKGIN
ncbi:PBP1A family penicillin-binding protein [Alphaproteobacteria bacterium]|nr:PBP1A family penicillin-binding protein [Alphaproteobacteria bacterium]